jgi:hypothetical protein
MTTILRFVSLLPEALGEAWAEARGRRCSRACSEMHAWDAYCICTTEVRHR